jgi:hypothetical protein
MPGLQLAKLPSLPPPPSDAATAPPPPSSCGTGRIEALNHLLATPLLPFRPLLRAGSEDPVL